MKKTRFKNGTEVRLKNRRIFVEPLKDGGFGIRIDIKDNIDVPRTKNVYKRGRTSTLFKLTKDASEALLSALYDQLEGKYEKD